MNNVRVTLREYDDVELDEGQTPLQRYSIQPTRRVI